ncbi:DUF2489 domain-containing protein [Parashewanella spongiae]|uniref:DUF2489 domain-containing protein n=1 Tax=Parashewanella spongiae TaxID=342950 RepID=A0A3A6TR38_9GAMM|nr:DUF2489 domain-containing protein [Parashewanella spongiae]MCL1079381.1 DUF2489 domain-containing protein [Parashewanella spongiae]RJY07524.1 DUF2489 domain-containing protein [Parashewanella spongiae]
MQVALIIGAVCIIVGLAAYATILILQLRQQNRKQKAIATQKAETIKAKQTSVLGDIRYIAAAMIEERCELSEGVMRIVKLFESISLLELVEPKYPQLFAHYACIATHPIMEQRKALSKQQRMKLDLERMKSEATYEQGIIEEVKKIQHFDLAKMAH